jgi:DNA-binding NarL/FixJ family response regulator
VTNVGLRGADAGSSRTAVAAAAATESKPRSATKVMTARQRDRMTFLRVTGAVEGMSNREIAQSLFVTVKTIEMHLGHAYRKLEIRSRAELAPLLAGQPATVEPVT